MVSIGNDSKDKTDASPKSPHSNNDGGGRDEAMLTSHFEPIELRKLELPRDKELGSRISKRNSVESDGCLGVVVGIAVGIGTVLFLLVY